MNDDNKHRWETPRIMPDIALQAGDKVNFNFDHFAITLARLITKPEMRTPISIGISGKWGSGKTTLLQRVKLMLDETNRRQKPSFANEDETSAVFRRCKTVWFDAWKYNDENALLVALVRVILNTMNQGSLGDKLWSEILDKTAPRYDVLATFLNMFKVKFGGVDIGIDLNKYKTDTPFFEHTAFFDHFNPAFDEILARWVHGKGNVNKIDDKKGVLVVFIDDLDRCLPEKTVQVLEAIKLFLDKPGCIFVLGADTRIVQESVVKHYRDSGVNDENVGDYIEKIIQLRFDLPPIPEKEMNAYVKSQVEDDALAAHWKIIAAGAEANPRKVKAFLNDLRLRWSMWQNTGQSQGVDFDDFIRWEVLMRAAPRFRKRVYGIYDPQIRHSLLQNAFSIATGDESGAASFKEDINDQMRIIIKEIYPFRDRYSVNVLERLLYVFAPQSLDGTSNLEKSKDKIPDKKIGENRILNEKIITRHNSNTWGGVVFLQVPRGKFLMGSTKDNPNSFGNEHEQHAVNINYDYWIGRFSITNAQFANFVEKTKYKTTADMEGGWSNSGYSKRFTWRSPHGSKINIEEMSDFPVVQVSWLDVIEYCGWLNQTYGKKLPENMVFRLPSEAEWEKSARGEYGNEWPWGNEFDEKKCNTEEGGGKGITPVNKYSPQGDSPYGAADMSGNVFEWVQSIYKEYPYSLDDGREDLDHEGERVVRGGSYDGNQWYSRSAFRHRYLPNSRHPNLGFRIVIAPGIK